MSLETFVRDNPLVSEHEGLDKSLRELQGLRKRVKRLERFREILRTLLDSKASMAEFHEAVKAVIG